MDIYGMIDFAHQAGFRHEAKPALLVDVLENGIQLDLDVRGTAGDPLRLYTSFQSSPVALAIICWLSARMGGMLGYDERLQVYKYITSRIDALPDGVHQDFLTRTCTKEIRK